jgi:hypothetical protein
MSARLSSTVSRFCDDFSARMRAYRFLNNEAVEVNELISVCSRLDDHCFADQDILVPIDETAVSVAPADDRFNAYSTAAHRWLGVLGDNKSAGFCLYAGLAIDEDSGLVYGLSDMLHHCIPPVAVCKNTNTKQRSKRQRSLTFEQRASNAWSLVAANSHKQLSQAKRVTYIMDRGSDSYAVLAHILRMERAEVVLRLNHNRNATQAETGMEGRLAALLAHTEWQSYREVHLPKLDHYSKSTGKRKQRSARDTRLQLRYIPCEIGLPAGYDKAGPAIERPLYVIEVTEDSAKVPDTEEPLHWKLITSRPVNDAAQAWYIVNLYIRRWVIEQLFRILKKQGLDIESTQFKNPEAIVKQTIMAMSAAAKVLQLDQAKKATEPIPVEIIFDTQEQHVLNEILPELEGNTEKQQNPHKPDDLRWAAWIIARLGGWSGYASQRPPGPLTFKRGLERFETILWTMRLAQRKHEK